MNPLAFWNELAELPRAPDVPSADRRMEGFVDAVAALTRACRGLPPVRLRMHHHPGIIELAPQYMVSTWLARTDRDRRLLFQQLAAASPLLNDATNADAHHRYGCSDCKVFDQQAMGCRAAWAASEVAVSLDSDVRWQTPFLEAQLAVLGESGEVEEQVAQIRNVARAEDVKHHAAWLGSRVRRSIADARDLWRRRGELFPHLEFCTEVEGQLSRLDAGSDELRNAVTRLFELQDAFASWAGRPIDPTFAPTKCTPESPQTLKEEAAEHTFTLENGSRHLFSWHLRFTPGAGRIFFDGLTSSGRGCVGYVGMKKGNRLT
jgi:hypothetical protein